MCPTRKVNLVTKGNKTSDPRGFAGIFVGCRSAHVGAVEKKACTGMEEQIRLFP